MGGPVAAFIERLLDSKEHPQQAFKSCMGVLQLSKGYKREELEAVCSRAIEYNCISLKFLKNSLKNNIHKTEQEKPIEMRLPFHENIRGKEHYK
jgi:hypothetical protein